VKPFELLGHSLSPDGTVLKLVRRDAEYLILADDKPLMSSRMHASEEALAAAACREVRARKNPCALIGGLGMGFTLRAALDRLPSNATIVVAELIPAVVEWNRGPLSELAAHPLQDKRVHIEINDVAATLRSARDHFDAILLDVDNGPAAFTVPSNATLYDDAGIATASTALKPNGVLAVWSARTDKNFERRLRQANFTVTTERASAVSKTKGSRHTIYLAHKSQPGRA
jgi:spermidine synthase